MRRRQFIIGAGSAVAAWPITVRAQQAGMPTIGFLHSGSPEENAERLAAWRKGLHEAGFVEGQNVAIDYRWATGRNDRLPEMADDLIRRRVAVIATPLSTPASVVARKATATIPVVFATGTDPVALGLVASLNRPGGNVTGVTAMNADLAAKRLGLLQKLVPQAVSYFAVVNPTSPLGEPFIKDLQAGTASLGINMEILRASTDAEIEGVFAQLPPKAGNVLLFCPDSFFYIRREKIAAQALRHAVPAIFDDRAYVAAGALAAYGSDLLDAMQTAGSYTGRVLKGEKPADLPVVQSEKFILAINLKTAKALGLTIPPTLLALADEVIE
jgi:putative ABC transport system substrate-binding protein